MVTLQTNRPEFFNDLCEVIRLYLPEEENILLSGADAGALHVQAELLKAENALCGRAACFNAENDAEYEYQLALPAAASALVKKRYEKRALKIALFRALGKLYNAYLPWGSLTGIRPTRLLRELTQELGAEAAANFMLNEFDVSQSKLALAQQINAVQAPLSADLGPRDAGVYIGVPFCKTRCLYCSFLSEVRTDKTDMEAYIAALCRDIRLGAKILFEAGYSVRSMYMGGGTPTVLTAEELSRVLSCAMEAYGGFGREFTVEAGRPDTITAEKLAVIREAGAKRISINPQSMNGDTLKLVGRSHTPEQIEQAFYLARAAGFSVINMDVIAGLPGEGERDFANTLSRVSALGPENLTVHTLAIKRSSRLKATLDMYPMAPAETADAMVELGRAAAEKMGMRPYYMYRQKYMRGNLENVGYALPGSECIYNIDMMEETAAIMAHGAGAMTKRIFGGEQRVERIPNPKDVGTYIAKLDAVAREKAALFGQPGRE